MAKPFSHRKPEQAPLIADAERMTWTRPTPAPQPVQKVGPVAPRARPRAKASPLGDWHTAATEPWPEQQWRMRELMRRTRAGEDFETVKRELWADQYQEQD